MNSEFMITLLKNGRIYDGTGREPYIGSILLEGDRIVSVEKAISEDKSDRADMMNRADRVFDLEGLSVSSGFIDAHSHNDWFAIKKDPLPYFEPFVRQGITTFVTGNCGLSATGFEPESPYVGQLGGGLFSFRETTGQYGTMEEFFHAIDCKNPCNIASLIGHCSSRAGIAGSSDRPLTMDEEEKMLAVLEKALQQGACGISLGLMYQSMEQAQRNKFFNKLKLRILCNASGKLLGFGFNDIEIAYISEDGKRFEGKTVRQIAREMKKSNLDTYLYLCEKSGFKGRVNMGPYSTPEIISELSKDDQCLYMTDAWVEENGVQNPAIYDCFPNFLMTSLLGTGDTMERTIRKMTGGVADRFSMKDRGYVRKGCFADLTVFHEGKLKSTAQERQKSFGIEKVLINGKLVLEDGHIDAASLKNAGRAIRSND